MVVMLISFLFTATCDLVHKKAPQRYKKNRNYPHSTPLKYINNVFLGYHKEMMLCFWGKKS
jgi:hypothetical protein